MTLQMPPVGVKQPRQGAQVLSILFLAIAKRRQPNSTEPDFLHPPGRVSRMRQRLRLQLHKIITRQTTLAKVMQPLLYI